MNTSEADSVLQQQSKRLAGLSITNSTGAQVSILNGNAVEQDSSPSQQSAPRSPYSSRSREYPQEEHIFAPSDDQRYQSISSHRHDKSSHDTGRSSSLTNASTPTFSNLEMAEPRSSCKSLTLSSQRSRSLSSGSSLSPRISSAKNSPTSVASPPLFTRSYSEDNQSDDSESCRRMSELNEASGSGQNIVKRKYSCSHPGCNKCFTTSGHLARHNRIHTGERNFACLMPGCPSKFSRQDNMMQHYRTHISPKSRRGATKKLDGQSVGSANNSQENLLLGREHSPTPSYYGGDYQHVAKMGGSRQSSPPRFNPFDRSGNVEYAGRHSTESHNGGSLRHKKSGIIQTHQHHTPMPHFNIQGMTSAHQQAQSESQANQTNYHQGALPSPLTPTIAQMPTFHHQPAYVPHSSNKHAVDIPKSPINRYRAEVALASPTSPMTQDVERMEGVSPSLEHDRHYYQQKYPHYHSNLSVHLPHAGHAQPSQHHNSYQLPPLPLHTQDRKAFDRPMGSHWNATAPPSPQSTPHTPTKHRFDPIQDCLQQEKQQQQRERDYNESHYYSNSRHSSQHHSAAAVEEGDEDMSPSVRSSVLSHSSSMTSISSASSLPEPSSRRTQHSESQLKQESGEEMSGLAHLAQIVTTYG
ncbi:hypothetical protein BGZ80_009207 [Entomortierella chlamydospora]|uniref:C2H2-type domain-containing protein n=1 Tax=Entomortierella chlamydospora TaxID=101097 RepID=A0A9P6N4R1_9FUNG|nr:hypothetical protein BGZ79_006776 [Entomortierella chlamydospora]KAG0023525.1 hypothetical protein BGZ80_009207 [Entomortierella chlamydospora]